MAIIEQKVWKHGAGTLVVTIPVSSRILNDIREGDYLELTLNKVNNLPLDLHNERMVEWTREQRKKAYERPEESAPPEA